MSTVLLLPLPGWWLTNEARCHSKLIFTLESLCGVVLVKKYHCHVCIAFPPARAGLTNEERICCLGKTIRFVSFGNFYVNFRQMMC